ncbi:aminopeptidase S [Stackebrandtia albiflava]|uniref:Aminopeptidase S n=2 Tax=Stackebrandtia albiflava TaxID=406432 RepID=A0A562V1B6_9ACTN|nr:aminopeptidase S [Stackebrandtia albiflava]
MHRFRRILTSVVAVATVAVSAGAARPAPAPTESATPSVAAAPDITVAELTPHLARFQRIADENGGNRAAGTAGYDRSADYVAQTLRDAGFRVERQPCTSCRHGDDNVVADWPGGDAGDTVMLGAHLDGVRAGPGADDNASGSAVLLAIALRLAQEDPGFARHVRFAWWAEEELGMHGSQHYVDTVGVSDLAGYVNLDMVGGVNAGYFVDDLLSGWAEPFAASLEQAGFPAEEMTDCCTDDRPFRQAGVPTTSLSTGYGELKTTAQAAKWGGTAGEPFDPCYHTACDAFPGNVDTAAVDRMADAAAAGLWSAASHTGNPYSPGEVCGGGYTVQESVPVTTSGGVVLGDVHLLWNGGLGRNCAVTLKSTDLGTPTRVSVVLETESGQTRTDDGRFGYYAGPVTVAAAGTCVAVTARVTDSVGRVGTGRIPMGHCG